MASAQYSLLLDGLGFFEVVSMRDLELLSHDVNQQNLMRDFKINPKP